MPMRRILVINPNSSEAVTREIGRALEALSCDDIAIDCMTLREGPPGIETQRDSDMVVPHLVAAIVENAERADAFVIACYSDPGLFSAREATRRPVFGIAQSALTFAANLGERTGVISIRRASVARHMAYAKGLNLAGTLVADLSVDLSVAELQDDARASDRLIETGRALIERHDANVIVLGCAGMARHRARLEDVLQISVVDPTQAAVGMALTALRCHYQTMAR